MDMTLPSDDIEEVEDADDFEDFDDADDNKGIINKLENVPGFTKVKYKGSEEETILNMNSVEEVRKISEDEYRLFFGDPEDVEENLPVVGKIDAEKIIAFITVRDKLGGLL